MSETTISQYRTVTRTVKGVPHSDGAGVRMTRVIASHELDMIDPFLLLDEFRSDRPDDYIGGFPDHPHRGFETVTYMLAGQMRHKDNHGHEGVISPGGVQWMCAGRGIIHSEMPEQEDGLMWGFQIPGEDGRGNRQYNHRADLNEIHPVIKTDQSCLNQEKQSPVSCVHRHHLSGAPPSQSG